LFISTLAVSIYAQDKLLIQKRDVISVIEKNPDNEINLLNNISGNLVGYNWRGDSLNIFISDNGAINKYSLQLNNLKNNLPERKFLQNKIVDDYRVSYIRDNVTIYKEYSNVIHYYRNDSLIWTKRYGTFNVGILSFGKSFNNVVISESKDRILFIHPNRKLIELNLETKEEAEIANNVNSYHYSPTDRYILITERGKYRDNTYLYDSENNVKIEYDGLLKAFWMYK
jgi:hypothetical protein